jgi:hypothetical protein
VLTAQHQKINKKEEQADAVEESKQVLDGMTAWKRSTAARAEFCASFRS